MGKKSREKKEKKLLAENNQTKKEKNIPTPFLVNFIKGIVFLSLVTPLILNNKFFFPYVAPKSLFFMAMAQILFFSWIFLIILYPKYRPKINLLLIFLILYLIVFILSSLFGVDLSRSFWSKPERMTGILMHLHLFAFFLVLSSVFEKEDFKKFFIASNIIAIFAGFWALLKLKDLSTRGGGTLGNESFLGTFLLFNCFFAIYLIFKTKNFARVFSIISLFSLIVFLLLAGVHLEEIPFSKKILAIFFTSGARAAKISFYGGLILFFLFWLFSKIEKLIKFIVPIVLISFFILVFVFNFVLVLPPNPIKNLIQKERSLFQRELVWEGAWKGFLEKPWLGWGPENFEISFTKYFNPCMFLSRCGGEIWFDRAHNIIFDTLVSTGILGTTFYFLLFFSSFYILWKKYFQKEIDFLTAGVFTSLLISYFVQNLTVFDMVSSYLMLFLVFAFIASFEKKPDFFQQTFKKISPILLGTILVLFLASFFYFVVQPTRSNIFVIKSIINPNPKQRISLYEKSLKISPLGKYQIRDFFARNAIKYLQTKKEISLEELKLEVEFLIKELEKSIKESPLDFRSHLVLGEIYNFYSFVDPSSLNKAENVLKKAIELSPTNQQGYWGLAQTKIYQQDFNQALSLSERALELEPEFFHSHLIVIKIAKIIGKKEILDKKIEEALKINPSWENQIKNELIES